MLDLCNFGVCYFVLKQCIGIQGVASVRSLDKTLPLSHRHGRTSIPSSGCTPHSWMGSPSSYHCAVSISPCTLPLCATTTTRSMAIHCTGRLRPLPGQHTSLHSGHRACSAPSPPLPCLPSHYPARSLPTSLRPTVCPSLLRRCNGGKHSWAQVLVQSIARGRVGFRQGIFFASHRPEPNNMGTR